MEQKKIVFDDIINTIGRNIRWIRKSLKIRQTELVARLQLCHVDITRETLVKIEGGEDSTSNYHSYGGSGMNWVYYMKIFLISLEKNSAKE